MKRQNITNYSDFCSEIVKSTLAPNKMQEMFCAYDEKDVALVLTRFSKEEREELFRACPLSVMAQIFKHITDDAKYFELLSFVQKVLLIFEMDTGMVERLVNDLSNDERNEIVQWIVLWRSVLRMDANDKDDTTSKNIVEISDNKSFECTVGVMPNDLNEGIFHGLIKRVPWLCVLLALGFGVSATVGIFESVVAKLPIIMCFQSMILDMAGNVGTQSLAVTIRALVQMEGKQKLKLVWKELCLGMLNGGILGILSALGVGAYMCLKGNELRFAFAVSGCLGVAMLVAMTISSLFGTLIPMLFKRIGVDPAVASGPLITTINDLIAVISYYGLAWLVLIEIMGLGA